MNFCKYSLLAFLACSGIAEAQTIGVSISDLDKFRTALLAGVTERGQSVKGVDLVIENAKGDNELQKAQVKKLVSEKVDAIVVVVADGDMGPSLSKTAADAGIPLIFLNNVPSNFDSLPANQVVVASDEKESGTMQTKQVCSLLGGKGRVVVLMGELVSPAARTRTQDIIDVAMTEECKGLQLVERQAAYWSRDYADQQMQEWLSAGVQFDAVIANNDEMALGALRALKRNNVAMKDVVIAGIDATDDALAAMAAGELDVTVLQSAVGQGGGAVDAALKLAQKQNVPKENYIPFELVTPQTIAKFLPKSQ